MSSEATFQDEVHAAQKLASDNEVKLNEFKTQAEEEQTRLKARLDQAELEKQEFDATKNELAALKTTVNILEHQLDTERTTLQERNAEIQALNHTMADCDAKNVELQATCTALSNEIASTKEHFNTKSSSHEETRKDLESKVQLLREEFTAQLAIKEEQMHLAQKDHQAEIERLRGEIQSEKVQLEVIKHNTHSNLDQTCAPPNPQPCEKSIKPRRKANRNESAQSLHLSSYLQDSQLKSYGADDCQSQPESDILWNPDDVTLVTETQFLNELVNAGTPMLDTPTSRVAFESVDNNSDMATWVSQHGEGVSRPESQIRSQNVPNSSSKMFPRLSADRQNMSISRDSQTSSSAVTVDSFGGEAKNFRQSMGKLHDNLPVSMFDQGLSSSPPLKRQFERQGEDFETPRTSKRANTAAEGSKQGMPGPAQIPTISTLKNALQAWSSSGTVYGPPKTAVRNRSQTDSLDKMAQTGQSPHGIAKRMSGQLRSVSKKTVTRSARRASSSVCGSRLTYLLASDLD